MKKVILSTLALFSLLATNAQELTYKTINHNSAPAVMVNMSDDVADYDPKLVLIKSAAPVPASSTKYQKLLLDEQRKSFVTTSNKNLYKATAPAPTMLRGFIGNGTNGTPNDNDVCIGNNGFIISVVNTNFVMYNDTGRFLLSKSLSNFGKALGTLNRTYDPRAIYDPVADRFIVVFLQGTTSADTRIITGFSKTNDPTKDWNFYAIPGNTFGDSSWSDYPIISLSNNELFITVNRLRDNSSWQEGFIESLIWQVNKNDGYNGDSLRKKLYYDIKYNDKPIWSICPVKGSNEYYGPGHYFVSVRPSALQNDTVFLHEITDDLNDNPTLTLKVLKTDVAYGLQPNARQPSGQYLQTNDARVLSATHHGGIIHYVGNTINPTLFAPSVYYGKIDVQNKNNPTVKGRIISYDSMDIAYPSIAYAGGGFGADQSMMITFSHVSRTKFPGNSVVYADWNGELSAPVHLREGNGSVNVLLDTIERWGDYTGIQPIYNKLGECIITNSYGVPSGGHNTWVSRVKSNDVRLGVKQNTKETAQQVSVYPVPTKDYAQIEFELNQSMILTFSLVDVQGKSKIELLRDKGKPGINKFTFSTTDLPNGVYILNVNNHEKNIISKRIMVAH